MLEAGDGLEVCRRLGALNPNARIVVLTGDNRVLRDAANAGYVALLKPTAMAVLSRALRGQAPQR